MKKLPSLKKSLKMNTKHNMGKIEMKKRFEILVIVEIENLRVLEVLGI